MIIKEVTGKGTTIEAAREDALVKLGAGIEEDVQFDVIAFPKKKVLGLFGGGEALVRAYVEGPDAPAKPAKKENRNKQERREKSNKPAKKEEAVKEAKPAKEPKATEAAKIEETVGIPADKVDPASPAGKAYAYLAEVLKKLGCDEINATISEVEGGSKITLESTDKLGVVIGRRGETLDALQYLASLVANENGGGYYRIVIDIGNYREKREGTLIALAKRTAGQVLRTGKSRSLEPMNPYERRIIHTAVQAIEGVSSSSIGDGSNRRVVITPEGKPVRVGGNNRGRGNRQPRSAGHVETASAPVEAKAKETDGTKLYGKLK